jgi:hypothetical protein
MAGILLEKPPELSLNFDQSEASYRRPFPAIEAINRPDTLPFEKIFRENY